MLERYSPRTRAIVFLSSVVVIIVCLVWISSRLKKGNAAPKTASVYMHCAECGEVYRARKGLQAEPPLECKKCGKKTAWIAMQCRDCGEIFPFAPPVDEDGNRIERNPACPKCGSFRYARYDPKKGK